MQSDIFRINQMTAPWEGLHYSVTWPNRGTVGRHRYVMLEQALKTGSYRIGLYNGHEAVRINADVIDNNWRPEMLDHIFGKVGELTSVAFTDRKYAEDFVDRMEKIIAWKMLKKVT